MRRIDRVKLSAVLMASVALVGLSGCMTVRQSESVAKTFQSKDVFANKRISVLPVKTQASIATDSVLPLKLELNKKLDEKAHEKFAASKVMPIKSSVDTLNQKGRVDLLDQLITTYDNTGVFDRKVTDSLGKTLEADYIIFSRLKAEKMDIAFLSKGMGTSLEVLVIDTAKNEIMWGDVGEYKKGGIYGFGEVKSAQAADELVRLAFQTF